MALPAKASPKSKAKRKSKKIQNIPEKIKKATQSALDHVKKLTSRKKAPKDDVSGYLTEEAETLVPGEGVLGYRYTKARAAKGDSKQSPKNKAQTKESQDSKAPCADLEASASSSVTSSGSSGFAGSTGSTEGSTDPKEPTEPNGNTEEKTEDGFIAFDMSDSEEEDEGMAKVFEEYEQEEEKKEEQERSKAYAKAAYPVPDFPCPWLKSYPACSLSEQFAKEVRDYAKYVAPPKTDIDARSNCIARISRIVSRLWPEATCHKFGSFATGMFLPGADIDLVILSPSKRLDARRELFRLADRVRRNGWADKVEVISRARVPIIKFIDNETQLPVDISFEQATGLRAVKTVTTWRDQQQAIKPLSMAVKQFLRKRRLNEVFHGGLGGYAVICMVTSFLRNHPQVKTGEINAIDNLGVLLLEFFMLYGKTFDASTYALSMTGDMPYISKRHNVNLQTNQPDVLAIEDPNDPGNNITRSSFNYPQVRREFSHAADLLKRMCHDLSELPDAERAQKSILAPILRQTEELRFASPTPPPQSSKKDALAKRMHPRSLADEYNAIASRLAQTMRPGESKKRAGDTQDASPNTPSPKRAKRSADGPDASAEATNSKKSKKESKSKSEKSEKKSKKSKEHKEKKESKKESKHSPPPPLTLEDSSKDPKDSKKDVSAAAFHKTVRPSPMIDHFEAASSSSDSSDMRDPSAPLKDSSSSESEDSRVKATTAEKRQFWNNKARTEKAPGPDVES